MDMLGKIMIGTLIVDGPNLITIETRSIISFFNLN